MKSFLAAFLVFFGAATAFAQPQPEGSTGRTHKEPVYERNDMVVAAHPLGAEAGREILRAGGNAIDAAIATGLVLNLVEPQSSGLGGGGFLVFWSQTDHRTVTFDGREAAPMAAKPDRFLKPDGQPMGYVEAVIGGRSVGVPGYLRMFALAHERYGKLPWAKLFEPAIRFAENGFPISDRLHAALARDPFLAHFQPAGDYFYDAQGAARTEGAMLKNPDLAALFKSIAAQGPDAFYQGEVARDIVRTVREAPKAPGDLSEADLANYQAKERKAVCGPYREYRICGMGPPSSGAETMLEMLGMLQQFPSSALNLPAPNAVHLFAEAGRLAFADRERYLADTDFVPAPLTGLIDPDYLRERAKLIDSAHDMAAPAIAGEPPEKHAALGDGDAPELPSTSHLVIVDRDGNVVTMTVSIESGFGSHLMTHGFLLNNELTDFSFSPERDGKPVANRIEPGKRPRSAMSPTLVFDRDGKFKLAIGSAGGPAIIEDVAKTIIGVLDAHDDLQTAIDLPDIGNRNGATEVEAGPWADALAAALTARGHKVTVRDHPSGLHGILVTPRGYEGAADSRRDGAAAGD